MKVGVHVIRNLPKLLDSWSACDYVAFFIGLMKHNRVLHRCVDVGMHQQIAIFCTYPEAFYKGL